MEVMDLGVPGATALLLVASKRANIHVIAYVITQNQRMVGRTVQVLERIARQSHAHHQ